MPTVLATTETQRLAEQQRLDALKDADERNWWGQFATPPQLALDIAQYARSLWPVETGTPVKFLDPAIGTGSFYSAVRQVFPERLLDCAAGIELDPLFVASARSLWNASGLQVRHADFTSLRPSGHFNLLISNPPYVRHHHVTAEEKERLQSEVRQELGISISGLAGYYCYFLLLADKWLAPGGLSIWLIPSEFMGVNYGVAVKEYLKKQVTLLHVHRFCPSDVQFSDALVSSAIVVFRKAPPPRNHNVMFSFGGSLNTPQQQRLISLKKLHVRDKWTRFPAQDSTDAGDHRRVALGDLFTIKRGLATGNNGFFVLPKSRAEQLGIPTQCCRPILPSPRYLRQSVVESRQDGYPNLDEPLALIDCDLPEDEIRRNFPDFWRYLQQGQEQQVHEGYLASRRTPWYSQEKRDPAAFLCTYMGRSTDKRAGSPFRFIWNKSKATAANVYLMLYPKPALQQQLTSDPQLYGRIYDGLTRVPVSQFLDEGRVYGGGLYKLEPKELGRVSADEIVRVIDHVSLPRQRQLFGCERGQA